MSKPFRSSPQTDGAESILAAAEQLRRQLTGDLHEHVVEAIYEDAARIADRAVTRPGTKVRPTFDRTLDRVLTSRLWGFPIMILLFALMLLVVMASFAWIALLIPFWVSMLSVYILVTEYH